jgi:hypothetical protein
LHLLYSLEHAQAPSPGPRSSRSHALRYFVFLSVWTGLQFPSPWPLDLDLLHVVTQCMSDFQWGVLDPPVSVFSLSYTDTHLYIFSLDIVYLL